MAVAIAHPDQLIAAAHGTRPRAALLPAEALGACAIARFEGRYWTREDFCADCARRSCAGRSSIGSMRSASASSSIAISWAISPVACPGPRIGVGVLVFIGMRLYRVRAIRAGVGGGRDVERGVGELLVCGGLRDSLLKQRLQMALDRPRRVERAAARSAGSRWNSRVAGGSAPALPDGPTAVRQARRA